MTIVGKYPDNEKYFYLLVKFYHCLGGLILLKNTANEFRSHLLLMVFDSFISIR